MSLRDLNRLATLVDAVLDHFRCGYPLDDALEIVRSQHPTVSPDTWARVVRAAYRRTT